MWWPFRRRRKRNGEASMAAAESQAKADMAHRMTPLYEQYAQHLANLPDEELVARVARMLRARPS